MNQLVVINTPELVEKASRLGMIGEGPSVSHFS
jgi:hypothetical protein